jgi:hypothetical protein
VGARGNSRPYRDGRPIVGEGRALCRTVVDADLKGIVAKHLADAYHPKLARWHKVSIGPPQNCFISLLLFRCSRFAACAVLLIAF